MPYIVRWKKLPGKALISEESYDSLDEARASAEVVIIGGPGPVEVTVVDESGEVLSTMVADNTIHGED